MKILYDFRTVLYCLFSVLLVASCEEENSEQKDQPVQFILNSNSSSQNGRIADLDEARAIVISISSASGESVVSMEKIALYNFSNDDNSQSRFISEPISLKPGDYKITDFLVVDKDDQVIYVAPKEGSEKNDLVNDPLPINFSVKVDEITEVSVQVVETANEPGETFGYATFSIEEVGTLRLRLQAFIIEYENVYEYFTPYHELTEAWIEIYESSNMNNKLYEGTITPENNQIEIADNYPSYFIRVGKDFYETYENCFNRGELQSSKDEPIGVVLDNKATFEHLTSSEDGFIDGLVIEGNPIKLLYTTTHGLYKLEISDMNKPVTKTFIGEYSGYMRQDYFGTIFLDNHYSTDQGETWQTVTNEEPFAFTKINNTIFGRINADLYGKTGDEEWKLLSEWPDYTEFFAYNGKIYIVDDQQEFEVVSIYVTDDGVNIEDVSADGVYPYYNSFFIANGKLFLKSATAEFGSIIPWNGTGFNGNDYLYSWDGQINPRFYVAGYKNNLILNEDNRLKVIDLENCVRDCSTQTLATYIPEYDIPSFPSLYGLALVNNILFLYSHGDAEGNVHFYGVDLSDLELN